MAQEPALPKTVAPYSLNVSVNEVEITFHASDAHNLPVRDLRPDEVDVYDNDDGPGKIISMKHLGDRPVHAAFVIDTSGSVSGQVSRSRSEAQEAVQRLLLHADDAGTAIAFGRSRRVVQTWTNQRADLAANISQIGKGPRDPIDGTNVFDTLFSTCFHEFSKGASTVAANVILLFSDGQDTASYMNVRTAIDRCRESHTVVYAFSPKPAPDATSSGSLTLRQISEQTGGRLFYVDGPGSDIHADIDTVAKDAKDEYFLLYRPRRLNHDGSFHKIVLVGPDRVAEIVGTSGFYAPAAAR